MTFRCRIRYYILPIILLSAFCSCKSDKEDTQNTSKADPALQELNVRIQKDSTDHTLYYERGKMYYENNFLDGAVADLEKAIALDPGQAEYYHLLSDALMDNYRSKDALAVMQDCVDKFPERIPSLLKLSETQLILKQYDASLQTCSNILEINPQNAEAYFMMGLNLRSVGDMARAKNAFRKSTELDPELTDAWIILGQIFEDEDDPRALDYFEAAINVDRSNPMPWHSKAFYLQNNGRIAEALDIYKQINTIDKEYLDAYLNAGVLYISIDSFEQAREQFDIMARIKPQNYIAYYYRGITQEALGNTDKAREDYQTSLRLNSGFAKAANALKALESSVEG